MLLYIPLCHLQVCSGFETIHRTHHINNALGCAMTPSIRSLQANAAALCSSCANTAFYRPIRRFDPAFDRQNPDMVYFNRAHNP
jgi:hypothetical protein